MKIVTGDKFGELTIIEEVISDVKGHRKYRCFCVCGNEHIAIANNLLREITVTCKKCSIDKRIKSTTRLDVKNNYGAYVSYRSMLDRCKNSLRYSHVEICKEWLHKDFGFLNFLSDMGPRPENHTIDRIDNSKGYNKENCRWATVGLQNHNKSKSKDSFSKYKGVTQSRGVWIVQFYFNGLRKYFRALTEIDAATQYDNYSEQYYGDRPNNTTSRTIEQKVVKKGSVTLDKRTMKYRVRITDSGKRITIGYYNTKEEAHSILHEATNS